jgi:hypothetical protein
MTPVQIVSVIVIVAFVVLLVLGTRYGVERRSSSAAIRRPAQPPGGSATVPGDHRAGGDEFRTDALAAADDPIGGESKERSPA